MARHYVILPVEAVNSFDLPPVCVISGVRDRIHWRVRKYRYTPPWVLLLILCIPVGLLLSAWLHRSVRVELPLTDAAWRKWRLADSAAALSVVGVMVGGTISLNLAAVGLANAAWGAGIASLLLPIVAFLGVRRWVGPRVRRIEGEMIEFVFRNGDVAEVFRRHFSDVLQDDRG
jgi:hypothetical protein